MFHSEMPLLVVWELMGDLYWAVGVLVLLGFRRSCHMLDIHKVLGILYHHMFRSETFCISVDIGIREQLIIQYLGETCNNPAVEHEDIG